MSGFVPARWDPYLTIQAATLPFRPPTSEVKVLHGESFSQPRMSKGTSRPEQSRAFMEMTHEIEATEEHSAADKLMERSAKTKSRTQQVARAD
jgi:hypothetical protein